MGPEPGQHRPDAELEAKRQTTVDRRLEQKGGATEAKQGQCVPQSPNGTVAHNPTKPRLAARQAGHGGDMVGFQGMLQADYEAEQ